MSRALSRSLAVVALLAVVLATFGVVTPSLARITGRDDSPRAHDPAWLWQSHVYGGDSTPAEATAAKPEAVRRSHRPYKPPVAHTAHKPAAATASSWPQP
jgi:hypothetical protein